MIGNKMSKYKKGYTLVEVLVAMSIFAIATVYSVSIFSQSNRVQKRTANVYMVTSDARYALEFIAREIRMDTIDYDYSGYSQPLGNNLQRELALLTEDFEPVRFKTVYRPAEDRTVLQFCKGQVMCDTPQYFDITPEDLSIENLDFYINPLSDPYELDYSGEFPVYSTDVQPLVTIVMKTKSLNPEISGDKISNFQTTVTPRKYFR